KSVLVLKGVAYELEQTLPYQPIVDALRGLFARAEWKSIAAQLNLEPVWLAELARLLPELLTYFPHLPAPVQFVDESRLWESLLQFFRALSRQATIWLFIDDLHWADNSTIGWLGYFIRHISTFPCNVLATVRPISDQTNLTKLLHALRRNNQLAHLPVSELPASAMQKIAESFNSTKDQRLSNWLVENAEGNPFFITEIIRYAFEVGLLKTDGTLDAELFKTSPLLPPTVQNLIESRILRLSEMARHILHLAAVIGHEFDLELVQRVAGETEVKTLDAIEELQAAQLIRTLAGGTFAFDHSLTMQVTLKDMSDARRFAHHRQVGETLESLHHDNLDAVSGLIARHFAEGNLPARAASYAFRAGQSAALLAAWVEAIAFYEQAISLERDDAQRAPMYLALSEAHFHKGDFALAAADCRTAIPLARANADWRMVENISLQLNKSLIPQALYSETIALGNELLELGIPELGICAKTILGVGLSHESAHPVEAERHLREAERLLHQQTEYSGPVSLAVIEYHLASAISQQGRTAEAIALFRKVLELLEQGKSTLDLIRHILIYNNLAYQLYLVGDPSAKEYIQVGIKLAHEKRSLSHLPYLYSTSGEIALANHELDAAEAFFRDGLALAEKIPLPESIAGLNANLGLVAKERGDSTLAHEQLKNALTLAEQLGNRHLEVRVRIWLAPLQPPAEALPSLEIAHTFAVQGGLGNLLEEIIGLQNSLSNPL
ncbi:MAG TPA: AAA family ATPase, partial [Anaerolineales bacterium]|nr:AAA family ATPase [Anaerolineales bacterium]